MDEQKVSGKKSGDKKAEDRIRRFELEDGTQLGVQRPSHKVRQQAMLAYSRAFRQLVAPDDGKPGAIVREALDRILREQKLWDDAKQAKYEELGRSIAENERKLAKGRIKLSEAREAALEMRRARNELRYLIASRNSLDLTTAEAQAENAKFAYLVWACTVDGKTGKPYWKTEDDYHADAMSEAAREASRHVGIMEYGLDEDFEKKLPENRWLRAYGFADDKGRLINKDKHLVDSEGRLIDEDGRYIDANGDYVDSEGVRVDEKGDYKLDFGNFLTEEGEEVPVPEAFKEKPSEDSEKGEAQAKAEA